MRISIKGKQRNIKWEISTAQYKGSQVLDGREENRKTYREIRQTLQSQVDSVDKCDQIRTT